MRAKDKHPKYILKRENKHTHMALLRWVASEERPIGDQEHSKMTKQRTRGGGDAGQALPSPHVKPNSVFRGLCLPGVYDPALHDWSDTPEGAPDGTRYPTATGRDEVAESVEGLLRLNPDLTLQKPPFGVPMLVWHGLVPPSPQHRSIISGDHTGAMGVGNVERAGQHHLNDLRPWPAGPDDAGEGEGEVRRREVGAN